MTYFHKKAERGMYRGVALVYISAFLLNTLLFVLISELNSTHAAGFTNVAMRHSRMAISIVASTTDPILVVAKPTTTATEASVGISFATAYTVDTTASNITVTTTGIPATYQGLTLTAWPGIGAAASAVSSKNVTFASTDLNVANTYAFLITGGITNPGSTGSQTNKVSTHSDATPDFTNYTDAIDATRLGVYFVDNNGASTDSDQIVVTARVSPTYTFALSANAITLDTSLGTVEYPGASGANSAVPVVTATATTNANNGHAMWLKSGTASGLTSSTLSASIAFAGTAADAAPSTLSAGTEGVVVDVNLNANTSGSLAIDAEFNGASTSAGGTPSTSFQAIAAAGGPVGGVGDKVDIVPRVAISATTQSADDYTQTFTVIGAGNF